MPEVGLRPLLIGPYPEEPGKIVGGVEAVNYALAAALSAHPAVDRVVAAVLYTGKRKPAVVRINPKLEVRYVHVPFLSGDLVIQSRQCALALRPLLNELKPHVAHGHGIDRNGEVAIQLGLPSVVTVHGLVHLESRLYRSNPLRQIKTMLFEARVRRVLRKARVVISISNYDARSLEGLVSGQRISIPNPIAKEFFAPGGPEPDGQSILFAGVMNPRKNVIGLVNAFARVREAVPAARLVIAGPTPIADYTQQVHSRVNELQLTDAVSFLGLVSNEKLVESIHRASVLTLFSYEETAPTILAQALAIGRPAVASHVGGIPEMIINGESGFTVPAGDETALAERLIELLRSAELRHQMGRNGRVIGEQRYEPSSVAEQTVRAYRIAMCAPTKVS